MKVIIMRGLPGSGKSTWVKHCVQHHQHMHKTATVHSADRAHTLSDGTYKFDPKNVAKAHNDCLREYLLSVDPHSCINRFIIPEQQKTSCVIVDNTNTEVWEIAPYHRLAEMFNHEVSIIRVECSLQTAIGRGIHNVPIKTMLSMQHRLLTEVLPSHWNEQVVFSDRPFHSSEFM